ncbi:MAG: tetratricopeptide repeat protein [Phycisphaerales bacterium]
MSGIDPRLLVLLQSGRFDLAEREARRAVAEDPDSPENWWGLANALLGQEKPADALEAALESLRQDADFGPAMDVLARTQSTLKRHDEALATATALVESDPSDADSWLTMATIRAGRREIKAAVDAVDRCLSLDPESADAHMLRGHLLQRLGRIEDAGDSTAAALRKDPNNPQALAVRGWSMLHEGKYAEAQQLFKDALAREPDLEFAREGLLATLRVKFPPYRLMLRWQLWGMRASRNHMMVVFVGIYILGQVLRNAMDSGGPLRWLMTTLYALLAAFVFMTWVGEAMANATLRFHPLGRMVLRADERRTSDGLIVSLLVAAAGGIAGVVVGPEWFRLAVAGLLGGVVLVRTIGLWAAGRRFHLPIGLALWGLMVAGSIGMALTSTPPEAEVVNVAQQNAVFAAWAFGTLGSIGYMLFGSLSSLQFGRRG